MPEPIPRELLHLAANLAGEMHENLLPEHAATWGDLMTAGLFGLRDAMENFEPGRGVKITTYARPRIRGAMMDFLRARHPPAAG